MKRHRRAVMISAAWLTLASTGCGSAEDLGEAEEPLSAPLPVLPAHCDVLVVGGSLGAVMAAHQAAIDLAVDPTRKVCLVSERPTLGGQLTEQATPQDGGRHSLSFDTLTYFALRHYSSADAAYYHTAPTLAAPLSATAQGGEARWSQLRSAHAQGYVDWTDSLFQPGMSRRLMSYEPTVAAWTIRNELLPRSGGNLEVYDGWKPTSVGMQKSPFKVTGVTFSYGGSATTSSVSANITIDATEIGDLYPLVASQIGDPSFFYVGRDGRDRFATYLNPNVWAPEISEAQAVGANFRTTPDTECTQPFTYVVALQRVHPNEAGYHHWITNPPAGYNEFIRSFGVEVTSCTTYSGGCVGSPTWANSDWVWRRVLGENDLTLAPGDPNRNAFLPPEVVATVYPEELFVNLNPAAGVYAPDITVLNNRDNDFKPSPQDGFPDGNCPQITGGVKSCNILDKSPADVTAILDQARRFSLSLAYWMQHYGAWSLSARQAIRLRNDVFGAPLDDTGQIAAKSVAPYPYIREARRLRAMHIVTQNEAIGVSAAAPYGVPVGSVSTAFSDSVGIASYHFDTHGCVTHDPSGEIVPSRNPDPTDPDPAHKVGDGRLMQIPLGALVPESVDGLLSGNSKTMGVSHIANMAYRVHGPEAHAGQAAGAAAALSVLNGDTPVRQFAADRFGHVTNEALLRRLQFNLTVAHDSGDAEPGVKSYFGGPPLVWWQYYGAVPNARMPRINPAGVPGAFTPNPLYVKAMMLAVTGVMTTDALLTNHVTRGQGAKITLTALGYSPTPSYLCATNNPFPNVSCGDMYWGYLDALYQMDVLFDTNVTSTADLPRDEFAHYLVAGKCFQSGGIWCTYSGPDNFVDAPASMYRTDINIGWMGGFGIYQGEDFGNPRWFRVHDPLTRQSALLWAYQILARRVNLPQNGF